MAKHPVEQAPKLDFTSPDFNEIFAYLSHYGMAYTQELSVPIDTHDCRDALLKRKIRPLIPPRHVFIPCQYPAFSGACTDLLDIIQSS
ncbi:hypothetical protein [Dickeya solani]|uniref:Uncharacterized protein n=1 Tax=Dickeya solani TaxID=1089444 RepID=A0ABU4EIQ5_9GAMM|nr:hypothetical protein [Dickeya solani]MCA7000229.1 hypothetical protein [Dickeya solani]MCZ0820168.1 hypothetical protein [Dickeya solani]MDV6994418.1 hypothetical protein [Dickeya solani]MDV7005818.1 hypothetical protein [Dickeya solani]MDV7038251.1 hypothetical protein [Dickeya solani]